MCNAEDLNLLTISRTGWTVAAGGRLEWMIEVAVADDAFFSRLVTASIPNDQVIESEWLGPASSQEAAHALAYAVIDEITDRQPIEDDAFFPYEHELEEAAV